MNRILLIGTDPRLANTITGTLTALGFGVDVAPDSRTGLTLADRRQYSHLLVDNEIDADGGIRLFERLSAVQREATGVLLTAAANLNTVVSAIDAGMRRVLAKPLDFAQLIPLLGISTLSDKERLKTGGPEAAIARLSQHDIKERLTNDELIDVIRSVDYPFAGKERLEHFDRDTLERVVHLVCRWCRQRMANQPVRA